MQKVHYGFILVLKERKKQNERKRKKFQVNLES